MGRAEWKQIEHEANPLRLPEVPRLSFAVAHSIFLDNISTFQGIYNSYIQAIPPYSFLQTCPIESADWL